MGPGTSPTAAAEGGDPTRSIVVVVPFTAPYKPDFFYAKNSFGQKWDYVLTHKHGRTSLFFDSSIFQLYTDFQNIPKPPPLYPPGSRTFINSIELRYEALIGTEMNPKDFNPQALFDLIREALEHGMTSHAVIYADKLLAHCEKKKPTTSAEVAKFLDVYRQIQGPMKSLPAATKEGEMWASTFDVGVPGAKARAQGHFVQIYWDATDGELAQRFTRLEENYRGFFLWHAMQGIPIKVPSKPLVAVYLRDSNEFYQSRVDLGVASTAPLTDGFVVSQYNLLVLSPERTDGLGRSFRLSNQRLFSSGMSRQALLGGTGPELDTSGGNLNGPGIGPNPGPGPGSSSSGPGRPSGPGSSSTGPGPMGGQPMPMTGKKTKDEVAQAMTLAMVEQYDQDATDISTVSCEGSLQLMYVTGMLPQHVDIPMWLTSGAGTFFQRPRDAAYEQGEKNKSMMAIGLTTGYGRPNYVMQYYFRTMDAKRQLNPSPAALVRNVVSDNYFVAATGGIDLDNPAATPKDDRTEEFKRQLGLRNKARATAWALYYYLAKNRPNELRAYFEELNRFPRDTPLDPSTKMLAFSRAFNLLGTNGEPDEAALDAFGKDWLGAIRSVPEAYVTIEVTTPAPAAGGAGGSPTGPGSGPGRPMGPPTGPTGSRD